LTWFAGLAAPTAAERLAGSRAARWLLDRLRGGNLAARDGWDGGAVYLFDLGMIASGLLSFGRRTKVQRHVDAGLRLVRFLGDEIAAADRIAAVSRRGPASRRAGWSTDGVAHLAKLAQAFLLGEEAGIGAGTAHAARLVEVAGALQRSDGRIPTEPHEPTAMLHPHLYAAEGLWIWGSAQGDADALARARQASDWVWTHQLEDGGLPRAVLPADGVEQTDVTAQAVRLALALGVRTPEVERGIARLTELAGPTGVVYQPGAATSHANTWSTLFAAQALSLAADDAPALDWRELV
jgi:hypothetical protein